MVRLHQHKVFNVVYRVVGDRAEAEEIAQEVFIAVFKHIDSFRGDAKFSTWLYRIAMNRAKNRVKYLARRARRKHQDIDDTPEGDVHDNSLGGGMDRPDSEALGHELEGIIQDGLAALSEDHRTVIVLRDVEHMTYADIAAVVDLAEGTVKSRLYRARVALKEYVESRYDSVEEP